jgi:hypothetical protein
MAYVNEYKLDGNITERLPSVMPHKISTSRTIIKQNIDKYFDVAPQSKGAHETVVVVEYDDDCPNLKEPSQNIKKEVTPNSNIKGKNDITKLSSFNSKMITNKIGPSPQIKHTKKISGFSTQRYYKDECNIVLSSCSCTYSTSSLSPYVIRQNTSFVTNNSQVLVGKLQTLVQSNPDLSLYCTNAISRIDNAISASYPYNYPVVSKRCIKQIYKELNQYLYVISL